MSVLIHFSIFPTDKQTSASPYVARAVRIIRDSGLPYKLGPMSTAVEGEWEEVILLLKRWERQTYKLQLLLRLMAEPQRQTGFLKQMSKLRELMNLT